MIYPDAMHLFLAAWLFSVGASVGSFVNVVVYRIPAGMSVAKTGSRCPQCLHPIRWFDNIPIAGWLWLRGRCRDCRAPISSRYPLVETLFAVVFLVLAIGEGFRFGGNLPLSRQAFFEYRVHGWWIWVLYAYHVILLATLMCAALLRWDRRVVPWSVLMPAALLGIVAAPLLPRLHPVHFSAQPLTGWMLGFADATIGGVVTAIAALASLPLLVRQSYAPGLAPARPWSGNVVAASLVGMYLGWQAGLAVILLAGLLHGAASLLSLAVPWLTRFPQLGWMALASCLWILFWKPTLQVLPEFGPQAGPAVFIATLAAILVLSAVHGHWYVDRQSETDEEPIMYETDPQIRLQKILNSPSYQLAELDTDFLQRPELRPVRLQLELLKPEMAFEEQQIRSTIVAFGGTQISEPHESRQRLEQAQAALQQSPDDPACQRAVQRAERIVAKSRFYDEAREFGRIVSATQADGRFDYVIITGGGPGIMEAANRGAFDVQAKSIGLNITLPEEQAPNPYITPELCFKFHYFALRKMHFLFRAKALVVFPGGFGTLDELFDALTLRQTQRMQEIPIILYGREYWQQVINFQFLADEGVIADRHLELISYADTPQQAWEIIARFHNHD